jgi:ParB family chromosome partitioning protein
MSGKRPKLGRGLDVLLNLGAGETAQEAEARIEALPVERLRPGRFQPRQRFDEEALQELADSIRAQGIIQPVVVRRLDGGAFEVIAGERRLRAAKLAGLSEVPCVVREADDRSALAMALVENIQREDLNVLEQAQALDRLLKEFALTHEQLARAVGRSRASVSNLLRLLELPEEVRRLLAEGGLDMGHARALVTLPRERAVALAREAAAKGWTVRELERRVQARRATPRKAPAGRDADVVRLADELGERLGTRVEIRHGRRGRGRVILHYFDLDQLQGILDRIR